MFHRVCLLCFCLWKCAKEVAWNRSEKWRKVHIACVGLITKRAQALAPVQRFSLEVGYPNHADGIQRYPIGWTGFEQYLEILKYRSWTVSWSNLCILYKATHLTVIYKGALNATHVSPQQRGRNHSNNKCRDTNSHFTLHFKTVSVLVRSQASDCRGLAGLGCYSCGAHIQTVSCAWKHFQCLICKWCLLSQNQNERMKNNYMCRYLQRNSLTMMGRNWSWRIFFWFLSVKMKPIRKSHTVLQPKTRRNRLNI